MIDGEFDSLDAVIGQIGTSRGVHELVIRKSIDEEEAVRRLLKKYGIK